MKKNIILLIILGIVAIALLVANILLPFPSLETAYFWWLGTASMGSFWLLSLAANKFNEVKKMKDFKLFSLLKPSLAIDGDQWCVLYGDNLHDGVGGFGDTPLSAIKNWEKQWHKKNKLKQLKE